MREKFLRITRMIRERVKLEWATRYGLCGDGWRTRRGITGVRMGRKTEGRRRGEPVTTVSGKGKGRGERGWRLARWQIVVEKEWNRKRICCTRNERLIPNPLPLPAPFSHSRHSRFLSMTMRADCAGGTGLAEGGYTTKLGDWRGLKGSTVKAVGEMLIFYISAPRFVFSSSTHTLFVFYVYVRF